MDVVKAIRDRLLDEFSLSKGWLITNLLYAIYNKIERVPIFIKSSKTPCRDTFWDATIVYNDNSCKIVIYYRDNRLYDEIDLDGIDCTIQINSDVNVMKDNVADYVERLTRVCYEKHSIKIVD